MMNRHTTQVLRTVVTVIGVLVFGGLFTGIGFLESILNRVGIKVSTNGFEGLVLIPLACVGILVVVVLSIIIKFREDSQRQEDLKELARQNRWTFTKTMDLPFLRELDAFLNDSWLANSNVLTGSSNNVLIGLLNGRNIIVSDQIYSTGSVKNRRTYEKTIVGIELPEAGLPVMSIYPEGLMDKVFDSLSRYDIDFTERPVFSRRYVLYGKNENEIRSFFTPKILDLYERKDDFTTVCGGRYLVIYEDRLLDAPEIMERLNFINELANLFLRK